MQLTYYNNKTDKRYLKKKLELLTLQGHANPVNIIMLDDTSITHPTFKLKDNDIYLTANYCYVDTLRLYYFIDDITLSQGFAYIKCTEDVLMTYAQQMHDVAVLVDRNQWDYNLYQKDDRVKCYNFTSEKRLEFPSGFEKNTQRFMLCVVGNTTEESEG
jgi:hypothetical protein